MKEFFTKRFLLLLYIVLLCCTTGFSQNSILVNFGSLTCADDSAAAFSLIRGPFSGSSNPLISCNLNAQLPSYYNVFIAYNPKDNKIYVDNTQSGNSSKVWVLDVGLPGNIVCPAAIPLTPTYTYSYVPNNFEFDNSGNLWSFHDFNSITGLCTMDNFDVTNGNVLMTKPLQFPLADLPSDLFNGDVSILPNGRMFVVFGVYPSKLYEVTNYNGGTGNAVATYLQSLPFNTFGLAYINGLLEITGTNGTNLCYFFPYSISTNTLGPG